MFKLEDRRAANGVYCGKEGLYLGAVGLIERDGTGYRVRPAAEIGALVAAAYETPPQVDRCLARLKGIAAGLKAGNVSLAQIRALQLQLADVPADRIEQLARTDRLLKANFNPAEPRDEQGRWTNDDDTGNIVPVRSGGHSPSGECGSPRAWEGQPNADFRNRLATAERPPTKRLSATAKWMTAPTPIVSRSAAIS